MLMQSGITNIVWRKRNRNDNKNWMLMHGGINNAVWRKQKRKGSAGEVAIEST